MGAWLYILRCADGSYYTGTTCAELEKRIAEHQAGYFGGYTSKRRRPVTLVYSEYFDRIVDAIAAERKVKGWLRAKKEALIANDFDRLQKLSQRRTPLKSYLILRSARRARLEGCFSALRLKRAWFETRRCATLLTMRTPSS